MEEAGGGHDGQDHQTIGVFCGCFRDPLAGFLKDFLEDFSDVCFVFLQRFFRGGVPTEMRLFYPGAKKMT